MLSFETSLTCSSLKLSLNVIPIPYLNDDFIAPQIVAETDQLSSKLDGDRKELSEARQRLSATDAEVERTSRMAKDVVEKSAKFRNLQSMKHFLYRVTRTNWEPPKEKDGDNIVRGFVINPQQRDIITFKVDRRDHNEDYLWSCIASGSDPVWRGTR